MTSAPELLSDVLTGGDDYEILAAVAPDKVAGFMAAAAARGLTLTEIGEIEAGAGVRIEDRHGRVLSLEREGWDHFGPS